MPAIIQDNRAVKVYTVLADNTLLFSSMSGSERLSTLFEYQLSLISENYELELNELLGTDITIEVELQSGGQRYFHGFISQCSHVSNTGEFSLYNFEVKPWFWFLTKTADCRIFQEMSVPDIIKQVLREEGFTDFEDRLTESYVPWNYCVQYRETDFNFLSRLMEQEGIYYYFKHDNESHKLILSDSISAHDSMPAYEEVPYYPVENEQMRERDHLNRWNLHKRLEPGKFVFNDFNFETPKANLLVKSEDPGKHAKADYEIYDYPGEYPVRDIGESAVRFRREESQALHEVASGGGNVQGLSAGNLFTLSNCDREDQNRKYLITHSECSIKLDDYTSGGNSDIVFHCDTTVIDSRQPFRAPRTTPKPVVQGPQTAMVVGPNGDEIWTDEHGRVKLQFHWDRYGTSDENSSCWIRVSQSAAGQGWGAIQIPRIGHEVIVEFLEGDPDRPIITGCVYNGDNKPPNGLPAAGMVSGMKSNSTPGGGGYNEMTMDDSKGKEKVAIHAQHDMATTVENDRTETVVSGNDTLTVKAGTQAVTVQGNTGLTVQAGDRVVSVTGNYKLDTTSEITMQAPAKIKLTCGGSSITMVPGKITISAGGGASLTLDANALLTSAGGSEVRLDSNATMSSPGESKVDAPKSILSGGGSTTTADASGVAIAGPKISLN